MFSSAPSVGAFSYFDHKNQDWKIYKSRLHQWFIANDLDDTTDKAGVKRKAVLLSALSESTYQLAANLSLPNELDTVNYGSILRILDEHFMTKRCGFAERHKFYTAVQMAGESHSQWAARLRGLAAYCAFKNLEDSLLDKFVMGMLPGHERDKLFAQDIQELTLGKAVDLAESVRCAREGAAAVSAPPSDVTSGAQDVFKITQRAGAKESRVSSDKCAVCGYKNHKTSQCRFLSYKCKKCNRKGHLRRMCPTNKVNYVEHDNSDYEGDDGESNINNMTVVPMSDTVCLGSQEIVCEFDSGSPVSVISETLYRSHFREIPLSSPTKNLYTYTKDRMNVIGIITIQVSYLNRVVNLPIYIIRDGGPALLGRDFMKAFDLRFVSTSLSTEQSQGVHNIQDSLVHMFPKVFADKLGCLNDFEVKLPIKSDAKPAFFKSRPVPFALRDKVNNELDRLVSLGILTPVTHSEYASPIVPVLKRDGNVRICADYSVTINKQLLVEKYPLPTSQELFSKLHGAEILSKLDLSMAYNQLRIHKDSQYLTCINTPRGLFNYTRLIFGLSSAPAIFQRVIESIVGNIDGVLCFQDDILIAGDKNSHMKRLQEVLRRLEKSGLTLRKDKCSFFQSEVSYLGFIIDKTGIRKNPQKVSAILNASVPKNVSELQSFLGLINYYRAFIPNAATLLNSLHILLQKGVKWHWTSEQDRSFNVIRQCLASDNTLAHFDNNAKLILTVDASPVGLGAILSQIGTDCIERPLSYASRSLIPAEKKYSQIQKEATAIIFGVKKFHQYLYGRSVPFVLRTDHKPLTIIFGQNRGIPEVSANRLQRYAIFLSAYNYSIEFINSAANTADFLSRAVPVLNSDVVRHAQKRADNTDGSRIERAAYVNFAVEGCLPVTYEQLRKETANDTVLKMVTKYVMDGWPRRVSDTAIKPYFLCRFQISLENGILLRGHKVIIPNKLKNTILSELHSSHFGIIKMKSEARGRFWFPGIDAALETLVAGCPICIQLRHSPPRSSLAPWPLPPSPFFRVHIDFLGPISNKMFLVIVDAYSKWVECYIMNNNITTKAVINKLCDFMSRFGIPSVIVSDNGTSFTSQDFSAFCALNNIAHLFSPVYHPSSNGQAESYVKIIKKFIKTLIITGSKADDIQMRLSKFLFDYRNSTNSTTETSPAQLVFGHKLRSRLDLMLPSSIVPTSTELSKIVERKQCSQANHYGGKQYTDFKDGDIVYVKKYMSKTKFLWLKGVIKGKIGKVMYKVQLCNGNCEVLTRHKNQIFMVNVNEDMRTAHSWQVTMPQEEREAAYADTAAPATAAAAAEAAAPASAPAVQPEDSHLAASSQPPQVILTQPDSVTDTYSDSAAEGTATRLPGSPVQSGHVSPASTIESPRFGTPQSGQSDGCEGLPRPNPNRRNIRDKKNVNYKKYF